MKSFRSALMLSVLWSLLACLAAVADEGSHASSHLEKICQSDRHSQKCLAALLTYRCGVYGFGIDEMGACLDSAIDTAALMDLVSTSNEGDVEVVAFSKELAWLMRQPYTLRYLTKIRERLESSFRTKEPFSLWDYTVYLAAEDRASALRLIGVLLQDTSHVKAPLVFLESLKEKKIPEAALEEYAHVLDLLEPQQLAKEKAEKWLSLYPPELGRLKGSWSPKLYHFYTIGYLSMRLQWMTREKRLAPVMPLLISASYKFRRISPERWPRDPRGFDKNTFAVPLTDIHAAYVGSLWAIGTDTKKMIGREAFGTSLAADPSGFLRSLIPKR